MTIIDLNTRSIENLADHYPGSRAHRTRAVSVSAAIRAIRMVAPDVKYSDQELVKIIAAAAVRYGHAVEFDYSGSNSIHDVDR